MVGVLQCTLGSVKRGATCHISWDFSILIFMTHIKMVCLGSIHRGSTWVENECTSSSIEQEVAAVLINELS